MSISSLIFGNGLYDTNTEKILRERIEENGIRIYGKAFENKHIQERINEEFMAISFYGNSALLLHASDVVRTAYKKGYPTSFHGNLGTSLVAFFLGLTGVNPLPFHCYCKECGYVKFYKSALDYKNRMLTVCPDCKTSIESDGNNLHFCFYLDPWLFSVRNIYIDVPKMVLEKSSIDKMDFRSNHGKEVLQINGKVELELLYYLKKETGIEPSDITFDDAEVFMAFVSGEVPKFTRGIVPDVMRSINPQDMSELVNTIGIVSGIDIWRNNEALLTDKRHNLERVGVFREDVFNNLVSFGIEERKAFEITNEIRLGYQNKEQPNKVAMMSYLRENGVPEYYVKYLSGIRYLPSKASTIKVAEIEYVLAWYKLKFPEEYRKACAMLKHRALA